SPKLPMIREALVFHYLDDLDSKLSAARVALATPSGDDEWSAYSSALGRRFLKLDEFLNPQPSEIPAAAAGQPTVPAAAEQAPFAAPPSTAPQAAATSNAVVGAPTNAKPSATPGDSQRTSTPPLESSQTKSAPKPKSEQGFLRKLFS